MKTYLALAVGFAVASSATAAELNLKNPAALAHEWDATIAQANESLLPPITLSGLKEKWPGFAIARPSEQAEPGDFFHIDQLLPKPEAAPRLTPRSDEKPHPKAREWNYRGQRFWILPLTT